MGNQPFEPGQLIVELWPRLRISVRRVERSDQHAIHRRLEVASLAILRIARQLGPREHRIAVPGQDRYAIPGSFAQPDTAITQVPESARRKCSLLGLELLQAHHVGPCLSEPGRKIVQALVDVVDVECGDLQRLALTVSTAQVLPERLPDRHRDTAISQAMRKASRIAPGSATPLPAMSKAVPWAGVVMMAGRPPATVTPRSNPSSFIAICPWSWYIVTTPWKSPRRAATNSVSAGSGPAASRPSALSWSTAGAMISISSVPSRPPSPACGLSPATAILGAGIPALAIVRFNRPLTSRIFSTVRRSATSRNGTCEVTRAVHRRPQTLISVTGPVCPSNSAK